MLQKWITLRIIFLFIGACVPVLAYSDDKTSSSTSNGNWLYVGGGGPGNYTKIQDAIDNTSIGDTVFVYNDSSPYYENIYIDKEIKVIGEDKNTTIIDGGKLYTVVLIVANNSSIEQFTIQNSVHGKRCKPLDLFKKKQKQ